jgi:hypothetical protein
MYNYSELNAVELSSTKKDFYQIWTELLEVAGKLSERWDPTSTNEADPGIVLLKVLTAIADKLNYAIDANTMEAFMPSAAQESSMRKLCEMLGYNMRYFESATTTARITYTGKEFPQVDGANYTINIDKFSNLKDIDGQINYITLEPVVLYDYQTSVTVPCLEGEIVTCETNAGSVVTLQNLDDNFRYYLPEAQIASNGIFISNIISRSAIASSDYWVQTDNLNLHSLGTKVYKFGFDSSLGLPYVQFPSDIGTLIADGLQILFVRTKGSSGNLAINTLGKLEKPVSWSNTDSSGEWTDTAKYIVTNITAAKNGKNPESIDEAYWNYQKTIGTFDTLVSCRDYMNKIYQLETSETDTTPLVSNVIVSDIRDDINQACTMCTLEADNIAYVNKPIADETRDTVISHYDLVLYPFKSVRGLNNISEYRDSFTYSNRNEWEIIDALSDLKSLPHQFKAPDDDDIACIKVYFKLDARISTTYKVSSLEAKEIENVVYQAIYRNFNMRYMNFGEELPYESILEVIQEADPRIRNVTLDDPKIQIVAQMVGGKEHVLVDGTSNTAASEEAARLYAKLAMRNVLAGRIALFNYNTDFTTSLTEKPVQGYDSFYIGGALADTNILQAEPSDTAIFPETTSKLINGPLPQITGIEGKFSIDTSMVSLDNPLVLTANEVVQFRFPSFKTSQTYPAYVNYFAHLPNIATKDTPAYPATFQTLRDFFNGGIGLTDLFEEGYGEDWESGKIWSPIESWEEKVNALWEEDPTFIKQYLATDSTQEEAIETEVRRLESQYGMLFKQDDGKLLSVLRNPISTANGFDYYSYAYAASNGYYYLDLNRDNFAKFISWLRKKDNPTIRLDYRDCDAINTVGTGSAISIPVLAQDSYRTSLANFYIEGVYKTISTNISNTIGYLVNDSHTKYKLLSGWDKTLNSEKVLDEYYVPCLWTHDCYHRGGTHIDHAQFGVGKAAELAAIPKNTEYQLKDDEYILINYSSSEGQADGSAVPVNTYLGANTIIRPNFDLYDSMAASTLDSFYKTSGYGPWITDSRAVISSQAVPGMFALGVQEQIEIREPIQVELSDAFTNLYWELLNEDALATDDAGNKIFPFDAETGEYTLQPGEYLYYTDSLKQDLAYYGSGTVISFGQDFLGASPKQKLLKLKSSVQTTAAEINELGLTDSIPWQTLDLSGANSTITIKEYQYINLVEKDTLKLLTLKASSDSIISNNFVAVRSSDEVLYVLNGTETTLPKSDIKTKDGESLQWQVASKLELNMSASTPQVLHAHTTEGAEPFAGDLLSLYGYKEKVSETDDDYGRIQLQTYFPQPADYKDVAIYANKTVQSSSGKAYFNHIDLVANPNAQTLSLKACLHEPLMTSSNKTFIPASSENALSKLKFDSHITEGETVPALTIYANVPNGYFGLLTFYNKVYQDPTKPTPVQLVGLKTEPLLPGTDEVGLKIFNYQTDWWDKTDTKAIQEPWNNSLGIYFKTTAERDAYFNDDDRASEATWGGYDSATGCYHLRPGLNIVCITEPCAIKILAPTACPDELYFSNLALVHLDVSENNPDTSLSLNPRLGCYAAFLDTGYTTKSLTPYETMLEEIKKVDPEYNFFYTAPINSGTGLELNYYDKSDTLRQAKHWFDSGNINNKFVVTEIDADYMTSDGHVAVSKFSRY